MYVQFKKNSADTLSLGKKACFRLKSNLVLSCKKLIVQCNVKL